MKCLARRLLDAFLDLLSDLKLSFISFGESFIAAFAPKVDKPNFQPPTDYSVQSGKGWDRRTYHRRRTHRGCRGGRKHHKQQKKDK